MFSKVLVANRGEIAVRVVRTLQDLGVRSVAVHSDADGDALHVRLADEAVAIGPAAPAASYLRAEAILDAAQATGADAVHPGYGFLSERADFARACAKKRLVFIGPSPKAMERLGDKVEARRLAIRTGVPVAQGSPGVLRDAKEAAEVARDVGYPVMLKAAGGGGGMGMRIVRTAKELEAAYASAREQAEKAFGNGALFLERFLERPRHIEVQVLGDADGRVLHFFERECSVQRRHQKLIEEAPSPALDAEARAEVAQAAVRLAEAGGYTNAGTVEFLYQGGQFFFNEVNARLQVEHPVTEMVTGVDLVALQLRVAAGEDVGLRQEALRLSGHALECRINAEDPAHAFRPTPGPVRRFEAPQGPGVRVDTALYEGWTVPSQYDSLVAKVVTWAGDRSMNLGRMRRALGAFRLEGFTTNRDLHTRILAHPDFAAGRLDTTFLETRGILDGVAQEAAVRRREAAALAAALAHAPHGGLGALAVRHALPARRTD